MSVETFQKLATILELDATDNTYKYALLRAISEICRINTHLMERKGNQVIFPIGLIVEKWLLYYWQIFEYQPFIPQMPERYHGKRRDRLQFRDKFDAVIQYYRKRNGLSQFYNDYLNEEIPDEINTKVLSLMKKIRWSIRRYPMKHLGYSIYHGHWQIFKPLLPYPDPRKPVTRELIIHEFGKFSLPIEYYRVFNLMGDFIIGDQSIFTQWAVLTEKFTHKEPTFSEIHDLLRQEPITERQVSKIRNYYKKLLRKGEIKCTWSRKSIKSPDQLHIDHMIPFSKWKNNDLWNLVPTHSSVNSKKKDKIPSKQLLNKRKQMILEHWQNLEIEFPRQFVSEIKLSLVGYSEENTNLYEHAFSSLREIVDDLINSRKYSYWNG